MEPSTSENPVTSPVEPQTFVPNEHPVVTPPGMVTIDPAPKPRNALKIGVILLVSLALIGLAIWGAIKFKSLESDLIQPSPPASSDLDGSDNPLSDLVDEQQPPTDFVTIPVSDNKLFYTVDNNIFSYDVTTKEVKQWTTFSSDPETSQTLRSLNVTETDELAFVSCVTLPNCTLNLLNLEDESISTVTQFSNTEYKFLADFFDANTYAYETTSAGQWQLIGVKNGQEKVLDTASILSGGRGAFIEDHQAISFSPTGQHLFYIDTASQKTQLGEDITVYVFDVVSGEKKIIADATSPEWLDNDTIVFRKYSAKDAVNNGLYTYTVSTATEQKMNDIVANAYFPALNRGYSLLAFTNLSTLEVSTYNLIDKQVVKVLDNASNTIWINGETIAYNETTRCTVDCGPSEFEFTGVKIKNLTTGLIETVPNLISVFEATTNNN